MRRKVGLSKATCTEAIRTAFPFNFRRDSRPDEDRRRDVRRRDGVLSNFL
jgi:hypothetical protein